MWCCVWKWKNICVWWYVWFVRLVVWFIICAWKWKCFLCADVVLLCVSVVVLLCVEGGVTCVVCLVWYMFWKWKIFIVCGVVCGVVCVWFVCGVSCNMCVWKWKCFLCCCCVVVCSLLCRMSSYMCGESRGVLSWKVKNVFCVWCSVCDGCVGYRVLWCVVCVWKWNFFSVVVCIR